MRLPKDSIDIRNSCGDYKLRLEKVSSSFSQNARITQLLFDSVIEFPAECFGGEGYRIFKVCVRTMSTCVKISAVKKNDEWYISLPAA